MRRKVKVLLSSFASCAARKLERWPVYLSGKWWAVVCSVGLCRLAYEHI